ncbi:MAG: hypothetical protein PHZ09_07440 [Eubacteriales bacterium]|nr:hypothetical protein [Eubacteriales bacterium]
MKLRLFYIILCIAALITAAAGCTASETDRSGITENITAAEESATLPAPDLPDDIYYDGYEFTILITGNIENNWQKNDFRADEQNGEVLNDARYLRNQAVQERFGVEIKTFEQFGPAKGAGSGYELIAKSVMSSDYAYDAGVICGYDICNLACIGHLYDLNSLPYLNLESAWWDQKANEDMTIKGRMFFTTGDISTADNDATYCILFNKKLLLDFNLTDPYTSVIDGKWTFDHMTEMGKTAASDLNGDGKFDKNDRFGSIIWDDSIMGVVNGTLEKCATVNNLGEIELTLYNEKVIDTIKKYTDYIYDRQVCYNYQRVSYDITDPVLMFSGDQSLFFMQLLDLTSYFRNMETDFGILPIPKYDEAQESFGHGIGSWHSQFLCVPSVLESPERSGIILEALAAESLDKVTPAYYEKTLIGKYFRDDESIQMLDIILSTRVYDLGWYYQIGKYNDEILYLVYETDTDFASRYTKYEEIALNDVKRINETFAEILK